MTSKNISIIIPSFNEEDNIAVMVDALHKALEPLGYDYKLIFVDDGSRDKTLSILHYLSKNDPRLFYVELSRNFGHQNALMAGLGIAKADCYITMDGDMQHPTELLKEMIEKWEEGFDIVYTRRLEDKSLPLFKTYTSNLFYKFLSFISDIEIEKGTADFRLMNKKATEAFLSFTEDDLFVRGLVKWIGFRQFAIDYVPAERFSGKSKYTIGKMMQFALKGITSFSIKPLYISIWMGLCISVLSFIFYIVYVFHAFYFTYAISGWASLIFTIVFFGGLNLIVLGIIGIYVGKIFMQSKNRPQYIIRDTNLN